MIRKKGHIVFSPFSLPFTQIGRQMTRQKNICSVPFIAYSSAKEDNWRKEDSHSTSQPHVLNDCSSRSGGFLSFFHFLFLFHPSNMLSFPPFLCLFPALTRIAFLSLSLSGVVVGGGPINAVAASFESRKKYLS